MRMKACAALGALLLAACTTHADGTRSVNKTAVGAGVGAVAGGVIGAVVPGVSTVGGAVAGGIAGAVLGAVINNRQYYRDTRGYCYYVDRNGQPIYDNSVRC